MPHVPIIPRGCALNTLWFESYQKPTLGALWVGADQSNLLRTNFPTNDNNASPQSGGIKHQQIGTAWRTSGTNGAVFTRESGFSILIWNAKFNKIIGRYWWSNTLGDKVWKEITMGACGVHELISLGFKTLETDILFQGVSACELIWQSLV